MWVYTLPWSVAQLNALALLAPDSRAVLGRWMRWLVDAVRPDGAVPALGDGADRPLRSRPPGPAGTLSVAEGCTYP